MSAITEQARKQLSSTKSHEASDGKCASDVEVSHEEFERLCTNCGKCCYKKIIIGSAVFITPFPCEHLDTETNLCTVYERRHEVNPECLTMAEGMVHSAFPADCGYVPVMAPPNYRPALDGWRWDGEWSDFDDLANQLDVSDETREKVRARGPWAPPMWVEANACRARKNSPAKATAEGRASCEPKTRKRGPKHA